MLPCRGQDIELRTVPREEITMGKPATGGSGLPEEGGSSTLYKKEFWSEENRRYSQPHYRLEKAARIINKLSRGRECDLLDVGCGPATIQSFLQPNIHYYGIDIAIHEPAPNLLEADLMETPIRFSSRNFDIILAQGFFEYAAGHQSEKFSEIAQILKPGGNLIVSYVNFNHRNRDIYWPYSNVQPIGEFRRSLERTFKVRRSFPTSHNWGHWEPGKRLLRTANMHININVPVISRMLGVEYFFLCSPRARLGEER
jgi:SAM-dependent methyltransferase